jgi:hypothetical protein
MCRWVGDHGVEAEVELDEAEVFRGELLDGRDLTADFADGADKDVAGIWTNPGGATVVEEGRRNRQGAKCAKFLKARGKGGRVGGWRIRQGCL